MKSKLLASLLLVGSSLLVIPIAAPAQVVMATPPPTARVFPAPAPRAGYTWVPGYYYPRGSHWAWHSGAWARTPRGHARWVSPRYYGGRFYNGHWR